MANEIQPFNYGEVEPATAEKLKRHEIAIRNIQSKAIYEIGEELQAAHDELADHNGGTFYAWCEQIGFKRETVKNIMNYRKFVDQNLVNGDFIESLPKSLVYEAARPSTPQELKDGVARGDITTLPQFKKLKAELEAANERVKKLEYNLEIESNKNINLKTDWRIEVGREADKQAAAKIADVKAELEATKGVLRATESKLAAETERADKEAENTDIRAKQAYEHRQKLEDELIRVKGELQESKNDFTKLRANYSAEVANKVFELQAKNTEAKEKAEKELNDVQAELRDANIELNKLRQNFTVEVEKKAFEIQADSVSLRQDAERERDKARADADELRQKAFAYDDVKALNNKLRERLLAKENELASRPERETIVTQKPADYDDVKAANEDMKKRLAEYEAREAEQKRKEAEGKDKNTTAAEKLAGILAVIDRLPTFKPDVQELVEAYLDWTAGDKAARDDALRIIRVAQRNLDIIRAVFEKPDLKVVKGGEAK